MKKVYGIILLFILSATSFAQIPEALLSKVSPAIFKITAFDASGSELQSGSGFFINSNGTGLTNYHVLEGATKAKVKTTDGKTYLVNMILSESNESDMVKFTVKNELSEVFQSLKINPNSPKAGESVFILTNDGGQDVTYKQRTVSQTGNDKVFGDIVSLTSSFTTGFTGAPLMNMNGEVYGIVSDNAADAGAINFCVSVKNMNNMEDVNALKFPAGSDPNPVTTDPDCPKDASYYVSSKVVFCTDVDANNDPKDPGTSFPIGKVTIYIDNSLKKLGCKSLSVKYYKKGTGDDKETLADEGTIPVSDGLTALWYSHDFEDAGSYRVSVYNEAGTWINDATVTITASGDDPCSTMYYVDSKISFCEKLDNDNNLVGESTSFSKGVLTIYVSNSPKNISSTSLKVTYYRKSGSDYTKIDDETITITGKYPAAYFTHNFTDKGDFKVSIYNGCDAWINSSELTIH